MKLRVLLSSSLCLAPLFAIGCSADGTGTTDDQVRGARAATVELRFTAERKADAIKVGYYEEKQFTGLAIVVASPNTDIDIDYLEADDSESVPDTLCYTGSAAGAKKIFEQMLANTDGNGDHYLGSSSVTVDGETLTVDYTTIGEDGETGHQVVAGLCK